MTRDMPIPPPVRNGRLVCLRPVVQDDYPFLYSLSTNVELTFRWRFRGAVPRFERFVEALWNDVMVQFVVCDLDTLPIGHAVIYSPDLRDGHAYAAMIMEPRYVNTGAGVEAMALLLDYTFAGWDFRKIYLEASEITYASFQSGEDRFFEVEACLREHLYAQGRHWDQYLLAFYRRTFDTAVKPLLRQRAGHEGEPVSPGSIVNTLGPVRAREAGTG
jgi:RimJ/RimL family protein N-acetyltransferase